MNLDDTLKKCTMTALITAQNRAAFSAEESSFDSFLEETMDLYPLEKEKRNNAYDIIKSKHLELLDHKLLQKAYYGMQNAFLSDDLLSAMNPSEIIAYFVGVQKFKSAPKKYLNGRSLESYIRDKDASRIISKLVTIGFEENKIKIFKKEIIKDFNLKEKEKFTADSGDLILRINKNVSAYTHIKIKESIGCSYEKSDFENTDSLAISSETYIDICKNKPTKNSYMAEIYKELINIQNKEMTIKSAEHYSQKEMPFKTKID